MYIRAAYPSTRDPIPPDNEYYNLIGQSIRNPGTQQLVKQAFFRQKPNSIEPKSVLDDALAFCSMVLTYAKSIANKPLKKDESAKLRSQFMPRTDFHTLYKQVESQLPGDLWTIIDTISCYKTSDVTKPPA